MSRRPRDHRIESREARAKLKPRKEPYWRSVFPGTAVGYHRPKKGAGSWWVRKRIEGRYEIASIGTADDFEGSGITYAQAVEKATGYEPAPVKVEKGFSVQDAADFYVEHKKPTRETELRVKRIMRECGFLRTTLRTLTSDQILKWRNADFDQRLDDESEDDEREKSKSSTNRNLSQLKAVLNYALRHGKTDRKPWDQVEGFRDVDEARLRFLTLAEARRLIAKCDEDLGNLCRASLMTGGRYGELAALTVGDYDGSSVYFRKTKSHKARHAFLSDEGVAFFDALTAGKDRNDLILTRDGEPWTKALHRRAFAAALTKAKLADVRFHDLRSTYGSWLAQAGVSMKIIQEAMGHADMRITVKHYAHLQEGQVGTAIKEHLPNTGFESKVARL